MFSLLGWHHQMSMRSSCLTKTFWVIMAIFACCRLVLNCVNKLWEMPHQKVLDIQKFEMDNLRNKLSRPLHTEKCDQNVITYHKKLGACFLCTQKHVRINMVHAFTEAVYIIKRLIVI